MSLYYDIDHIDITQIHVEIIFVPSKVYVVVKYNITDNTEIVYLDNSFFSIKYFHFVTIFSFLCIAPLAKCQKCVSEIITEMESR